MSDYIEERRRKGLPDDFSDIDSALRCWRCGDEDCPECQQQCKRCGRVYCPGECMEKHECCEIMCGSFDCGSKGLRD